MTCPNCPKGKLTYYPGPEWSGVEESFWFCGVCGHKNERIGLALGIYYSIAYVKEETVPIIQDLVQMFA